MRDYVRGIIHAAKMVGITTNTGARLLEEARGIHLNDAHHQFARIVHQSEDKRELIKAD